MLLVLIGSFLLMGGLIQFAEHAILPASPTPELTRRRELRNRPTGRVDRP